MPVDPTPSAPISELREWVRSMTAYAEARGRLLQIEARELGGRGGSIAVFGFIGLICLLGTWLLAAPALVWIISVKLEWHWSRVALAAAAIHLLICIIAFLIAKRRLSGWKPFEVSISELKKDREWLKPPQQP